MNPLPRLAACLLAAAVLPCAAEVKVQAEAPPGPALSAEQIVDRNVSARGGLDAWRQIRTMVWTGHMQGASADQPMMQFVLDQARPNRTRFEVNAMGKVSLRVFDGVRGWKLHPGHGTSPEVQPFDLKEVRFAQEEQVIDGPLIDYASRGATVTLAGLEEVGGHRAWHLDVTRASGAMESVWVDAETFLDLRYDRTSYGPGGHPVLVTVYYHDYHPVEGRQIPAVIDLGGSYDRPASRMVIEQVQLNVDLDPRTFTVAGSIRHRAKWHPGLGRGQASAALPGAPLLPAAAGTPVATPPSAVSP